MAAITGQPDFKHVSTSYIERQNLSCAWAFAGSPALRTPFQKKVQDHEAAIALHYMRYNFARIHQTLRVTSAMESSVTDHWTTFGAWKKS
jgi:mannose/fructose/N-acetylgalactosamine-specific phosphotransferase system component IID